MNYSKGLIANYTATLKSTLINSFRYGFIRESIGTIGNTDQTWSTFRGIDPGLGSTLNYSSEFQRPINTFWDDLNWTHGKHSLQFGFQSFADSKSDAEHDEFVQQRVYERAVAEHVGIGGTRFVTVESGEQWIPGRGL